MNFLSHTTLNTLTWFDAPARSPAASLLVLACSCTRYATLLTQICISYHTHVKYWSLTGIDKPPQKTATSKFSWQLFEVAFL